MKRLVIIPLLVFALLSSQEPFAGTASLEETRVPDTIVVTPGPWRTIHTAVPAASGGLSVIGSEAVEAEHPVSITDVIVKTPGVSRTTDAIWGGGINIRGLGRNRLVLLIDGCRVNTATDINAQFGLIHPMEVARVEIIKGPVSTLYGSGSIGGVVNIITRQAAFTPAPASHGTMAASAATNPAGMDGYSNLFHSDPDQWVYGSAGYRNRDSYRDGSGRRVHNSQFTDLQGKLSLSRRWNTANTSRFQIQRFQAVDVGIPGSGTAPLPVNSDVTYPDISRTLVNFRHDTNFDGLNLVSSGINAYFQRIDRDVRIDRFTSGPIEEIQPRARHDTLGITWRNQVKVGTHHILAGADIWNWSYEGSRTRRFKTGTVIQDMPLPDSSQLSAGLFVENSWLVNSDLEVNTGLRIDRVSAESDPLYTSISPPGVRIRPDDSQTDMNWSAHAGLTWYLSGNWHLTTTAASSYRAPDLMDRFKYIFFSPGDELYGNPDLEPERSIFLETGLYHRQNRLHFDLTGFVNTLENLIADPSPGGGVRRMENIDQARIYGGEAAIRWFFTPGLQGYATLSYARGRNTSKNEDLAFIPPLNGVTGLSWNDFERFQAGAEVEWAASQNDTPEGIDTTGAWASVNLTAGYTFVRKNIRHRLGLNINNLLDADYRNHLSTSRGFVLKEPGINAGISWMMTF
ncbi:MAG: TonB-dependent receptor [Desulfotignum sp.]|nr:TonB-dependent receptor [Desulfotignum sp.]